MQISKQQFNILSEEGAKNGLTNKEIITSLYRRGFSLEGVDTTQAKVELGLVDEAIDDAEKANFVGRLKETAQDVGEVFTGVARTSSNRAENIQDLGEKMKSGERSVVGARLKQIGQLAGSGADAIGEVFKGAVKVALSQESEDKLKEKIANIGERLSETSVVQNISEWYQSLPETEQEAVDAAGGVLALATEFVGAGAARRGAGFAKQGIDTATNVARDISENVTRGFRQSVDGISQTVRRGTDAVQKPQRQSRFGDIDEALKSPETGRTVENTGSLRKNVAGEQNLLTEFDKKRLLNVQPEVGNEYIDILKRSEADDMLPSVFEKAVDDTSEAIQLYRKNVSKIGSEIGSIKEKLTKRRVTKKSINEVSQEIKNTLKKEGLGFRNGKFFAQPGKNTPFSKTDINAINKDIVSVLNNVKDSKSMEELLLGMKRLDNTINFNRTGELTTGLQGLSKKVRAKLKEIRDNALGPKEAKLFDDYSEAQSFIDDFLKNENKVRILLSRVASRDSGRSLRFAQEIKRVTGVDVLDYARLAQILTEATGSTSMQRTVLRRYMGEAAGDIVSLSPIGLAKSSLEAIGKTFLNVDKLEEIQKAINTQIR